MLTLFNDPFSACMKILVVAVLTVEFVDSRPQFVDETPINGSCVTLEVGQTYSARITAEAISSSRCVPMYVCLLYYGCSGRST